MPNGTLPVKIKTDGIKVPKNIKPKGVWRKQGGRRRLLLAYGKWTTVSGREVVHTRRYHPIWVRVPGGQWKRANYAEFVRGIDKSEWFYHDGHSEQQKVRLAEKAMVELGILLPPKGRQVPRNLFYGDEFPDGVYGS